MTEKAELSKERLEPVSLDRAKLRRPPWKGLGERFVFGAGVALLAGLVGMRFGPRLGGAFLAFPAVLPAALSMVQKKEGDDKADVDALGSILGSVGMLAFALAASLLIRPAPIPALIAAGAAWIVVAIGLFAAARNVLRHMLRGPQK